jgi:RHS repeat-associated protein
MSQPGRKYSAGSPYRYGFNGKEKDDDVKDIEGSQQDYGMRIYDPRLGRFLSVDPLTDNFPYYTPYQFAGNTPIQAIDLDGGEPKFIIKENGKLTRPMIALFNSAFGYSRAKMQATRWIKVNNKFSAQTIFAMIFYDKSTSEQGERKHSVWVDYWLNLSVHEHKHRDEYRLFEWINWGIKYLVETKQYDEADGKKDFYAKNGPTEQRAYSMEDPMVELMNFQNSIALKVLESGNEYSNNTKAGLMKYIGTSFALQKEQKGLNSLKELLAKYNWSDKARKNLEKVITRQEKRLSRMTKKVDNLKTKYNKEIEELEKKQGRQVEKIDNKEKLNQSN